MLPDALQVLLAGSLCPKGSWDEDEERQIYIEVAKIEELTNRADAPCE